MKKIVALALALILGVACLASCGGGTEPAKKGVTIAIPNDATNEGRALLLLEALGYIKLDKSNNDNGLTATPLDIAENPYNITFNEVEAAQLPTVKQDVDYAIINSNYAIEAGLVPATDALALEGSFSAYNNILVVKEGRENEPIVKALVAALTSKKVADYIKEKYNGSVVSAVDAPTDGFDATLDYAALKGQKVTVAASPAPHAELLALAKEILAEKEITLEVTEFTDYVVPNTVVDTGELDANFFQHLPYLNNFNAENGTKLVSVADIHVEPMGIYGGKQTSLDAIQK